MKIIQSYITKNDCYKAGRTITPKGIMVHSTATPGVMAADWHSRWNKSGVSVAVHAFVDDRQICQHLPFTHRAWHCAADGNNTHIAFELCEPADWKTNRSYFLACYQNGVTLAAYLCQQYGLTEKNIISHKEGYQKGIASNHGDPEHWWQHFGYTMDRFRADVKALLKKGKIAATVVKSRPTVQMGCSGEDVTYLQKRLNRQQKALALAFSPLDTDGVFGNKTKEAVRAFQSHRKLTVDGIAGPVTWATLEIDFGDVNKDGRVDTKDASLVLKATVNKQTLTGQQAAGADMNGDGKVTSADAAEILKRTVGK